MFTREFGLDLAERAIRTFAQGFIAAFIVSDLSTARTASLAGVAAGLSGVMTALAEFRRARRA